MTNAPFNRHTGLIVLEVNMSNPNGDPEMESEPRARSLDGFGMISPVSLKRKYRDLIDEDSDVFRGAKTKLQLENEEGNEFQILEKRGRERKEILDLGEKEFRKRYWDARLFGSTFLESEKGGTEHFINTGTLQIGVGLSVAPIDVIRKTFTNKSGVEEGKDRGMAPLAFRVVQHGIYYIPYFVNPSVARKTGATQKDLDLFKFITPYVYAHTASAIRPQINILHAWCAEHKNPLGSCPDYLLIEALIPKIKEGIKKPLSRDDYEIPTLDKIGDLKGRFNKIEDLNEIAWN